MSIINNAEIIAFIFIARLNNLMPTTTQGQHNTPEIPHMCFDITVYNSDSTKYAIEITIKF